MEITDTHTHIYSEEFAADRDDMIARAIAAGVTRFFVPAIDSTYVASMRELERRYPQNVFLMAGLHPTYVKENYEEELSKVAHELETHKYYAVGEIGIDLYWDKSTLAIQQEAFRRQIALAKKHRLPINIHCRDAFDEIFEILEGERSVELRGIFHCFTGDYDQAKRAISLNMKLGIGGVATFKNGKIDQFLDKISLENIVLETDSPYLAPVPFRGKRNESSYIVNVVRKLSELYGITAEEIAAVTTENSRLLFGI